MNLFYSPVDGQYRIEVENCDRKIIIKEKVQQMKCVFRGQSSSKWRSVEWRILDIKMKLHNFTFSFCSIPLDQQFELYYIIFVVLRSELHEDFCFCFYLFRLVDLTWIKCTVTRVWLIFFFSIFWTFLYVVIFWELVLLRYFYWFSDKTHAIIYFRPN